MAKARKTENGMIGGAGAAAAFLSASVDEMDEIAAEAAAEAAARARIVDAAAALERREAENGRARRKGTKGARGRERTEEKPGAVQTILKLMMGGRSFEDAALLLGFGKMRISEMMDRNPEFRGLVAQARAIWRARLYRTIADAGRRPQNWQAAAYALERREPKRYGPRRAIDLTSGGEKIGMAPVAVVMLPEKDPDPEAPQGAPGDAQAAGKAPKGRRT